MPWNVLVHRDVFRALDDLDAAVRDDVARKVNWALMQLGATGRTVRVKGTVGQTWRRTPVRGNERYLWWTTAPLAGDVSVAGQRDILVRDLRHHDVLEPPRSAAAGEFELVELGGLDPRTDEQRNVATAHHDRIVTRLLRGLPGTGKTVALYGAAQQFARDGRVLYVTANELLAREAQAYLHAAAYGAVDVQAWSSFVHRCSGTTPPQPEQLREQFHDVLEGRGRGVAGPVRHHPDAAWSLLRAFCVGHALPESWRRGALELPACDLLSASQLASVAGLSEELAERMSMLAAYCKELELFRDLELARCRDSGHAGHDAPWRAIVVDEVQDLTALEIDLMLSVARKQAARWPQELLLLFAGDESQTVRASGFSWGLLKDLVEARLGVQVEDHVLQDPLRNAPKLAQLVASSAGLYRAVSKAARPRAVRAFTTQDGERDGTILLAPEGPLPALTSALSDAPGRALVTLDDALAATLPPSGVVFRAAEMKGLERRLVVVAGMTRAASVLGDGCAAGSLEEVVRRTSVDAIRVALSRATDTLVLLEDGALHMPAALDLTAAQRVSWEGLLALLGNEDLSPAERAEGFVREAAELAERGALEQAQERLQRTEQALRHVDESHIEAEMRRVRDRLQELQEARRRVVLSAKGDGDAQSLADALDKVPDGGVIVVRPGIYEVDAFTIGKRVRLRGEGMQERIVLRGNTQGALRLDQPEGGELENLTIEAAKRGKLSALDVRTGTWTLHNVVVSGSRAVHVRDGAGIVVRRSKLLCGEFDALYADAGSSVLLEDVEATGNRLPALACAQTPMVLRRVRVRNSRMAGIVIGNGNGQIDDCQVDDCRLGVVVGSGHEATLRALRVRNVSVGMELVEGGRAVVEDSHFSSCAEAGLTTWAKSCTLTVRRTRIERVGRVGIQLGSGEHRVEQCVIEAAGAAAIRIEGEDANPSVVGNRIMGGAGIIVRQRARGRIENNDIERTTSVGIYVEGGAEPHVRANRVRQCRTGGIGVNAAGGEFVGNTVEQAGAPCIQVIGGSPTFVDNHLKVSGAPALVIQARATGRFAGNTIEGGEGGAITVGGGSTPTVQGNTIRNGSTLGLFVCEGAGGLYEDNTIEGFPMQGVNLSNAKDVLLRGNRLRRSGTVGIFAGRGTTARCEANELEGHAKVGFMVAEGSSVRLHNNAIRGSKVGVIIQAGASVELGDNRTEGVLSMRAELGAKVQGEPPHHTDAEVEVVPQATGGEGYCAIGKKKARKKGRR